MYFKQFSEVEKAERCRSWWAFIKCSGLRSGMKTRTLIGTLWCPIYWIYWLPGLSFSISVFCSNANHHTTGSDFSTISSSSISIMHLPHCDLENQGQNVSLLWTACAQVEQSPPYIFIMHIHWFSSSICFLIASIAPLNLFWLPVFLSLSPHPPLSTTCFRVSYKWKKKNM